MKKHIYKAVYLLVFAITFNACESTLDINESQVDATEGLVTPDLLLAGAILAPRPIMDVTLSELGSIFMNQWGGDINNVTGGFQDEFRLNLTQNFYPTVWRDLFTGTTTNQRGIATYQTIINFEGEGYDNHKAIARILKSYYYQYLVDLYGDVPYSEALQFGLNYTPAYDDDMSIYRALIEDIDLALVTLNDSDNEFIPVGAEDVVFNGDLTGWVKVANTLKLRILLRQSELDGETASYLTAQFATLDQNFLTMSAEIDPPYAQLEGKQNPFWNNYGKDVAGIDTFDNDFIVPSEYMAEFLKGNALENGSGTSVADPRLIALYQPIPAGLEGEGEVVGVQQGADNTTSPPELSELGPGLLRGPSQVSFLFSAAESYFLQSEAAFRGYIGGDAKALFQEGILRSFIALGVDTRDVYPVGNPQAGELNLETTPALAAAAYIAASNNVNRIGWDGSGNKIEAIMTQKWIALTGVNAIESFIDYNRTGFPRTPLSIIAEKPTLPKRLLYPASEYSSNSANVPNQPAAEAFSTSIFWDVN